MYFVVSDKLYLSLILLSYPRCLQTCSMYVFCGGFWGSGDKHIQCVRHCRKMSFRLRTQAGISLGVS